MDRIDVLHLEALKAHGKLTTEEIKEANRRTFIKKMALASNASQMTLKEALLWAKKYDCPYFTFIDIFPQHKSLQISQYMSILTCPRFSEKSTDENIANFLATKDMNYPNYDNDDNMRSFQSAKPVKNVGYETVLMGFRDPDSGFYKPDPKPTPTPEVPPGQEIDDTLPDSVKEALQLLYDIQKEYHDRLLAYDREKIDFDKKYMAWKAHYDDVVSITTRDELLPNVPILGNMNINIFINNAIKDRLGDHYHLVKYVPQGPFSITVTAKMDEDHAQTELIAVEGLRPTNIPVYPTPPELKNIAFQNCGNKINFDHNGDIKVGEIKQFTQCIMTTTGTTTPTTPPTTTTTTTTPTGTTLNTTTTTTTSSNPNYVDWTFAPDPPKPPETPKPDQKSDFFTKNKNALIGFGVAILGVSFLLQRQ